MAGTKLYKPVDNDAIERIAVISRAIQRTQSLNITYSSASSGTSTRQIIPVTFADNWLRWQLRAYDRSREKYVDFVFSRIQQPNPMKVTRFRIMSIQRTIDNGIPILT